MFWLGAGGREGGGGGSGGGLGQSQEAVGVKQLVSAEPLLHKDRIDN